MWTCGRPAQRGAAGAASSPYGGQRGREGRRLGGKIKEEGMKGEMERKGGRREKRKNVGTKDDLGKEQMEKNGRWNRERIVTGKTEL